MFLFGQNWGAIDGSRASTPPWFKHQPLHAFKRAKRGRNDALGFCSCLMCLSLVHCFLCLFKGVCWSKPALNVRRVDDLTKMPSHLSSSISQALALPERTKGCCAWFPNLKPFPQRDKASISCSSCTQMLGVIVHVRRGNTDGENAPGLPSQHSE